MSRWTVLPPLRAWFNWHFEDLDKIPATGPVLIACNHASYLEPLAGAYTVVRARRRPRFLAKQELFEHRLVGLVFRGTRQIPVRRGSRDATPLRLAEEALAAGEVVVIYPEGTVTKREDGLPMRGKTGLVRISLASGVPITPMVTWGSAPVWQKSGRGSLKFGRPIWVKIGDPIDLSARRDEAENLEALRAMTAQVMDQITRLVVDVRGRYPKRWATQG